MLAVLHVRYAYQRFYCWRLHVGALAGPHPLVPAAASPLPPTWATAPVGGGFSIAGDAVATMVMRATRATKAMKAMKAMRATAVKEGMAEADLYLEGLIQTAAILQTYRTTAMRAVSPTWKTRAIRAKRTMRAMKAPASGADVHYHEGLGQA